jgi:hypothetical protein
MGNKIPISKEPRKIPFDGLLAAGKYTNRSGTPRRAEQTTELPAAARVLGPSLPWRRALQRVLL